VKRETGLLPHVLRSRRLAARRRRFGRNFGFTLYEIDLLRYFVPENHISGWPIWQDFLRRRRSLSTIHRVLRVHLKYSWKVGKRMALQRCQHQVRILHDTYGEIPDPRMSLFGDEVSYGRTDHQKRLRAYMPIRRAGSYVEPLVHSNLPTHSCIAFCEINGYVFPGCLFVARVGPNGGTIIAEVFTRFFLGVNRSYSREL